LLVINGIITSSAAFLFAVILSRADGAASVTRDIAFPFSEYFHNHASFPPRKWRPYISNGTYARYLLHPLRAGFSFLIIFPSYSIVVSLLLRPSE
jgi:membrane-bound acyltransferase YfiQ involved in biofilm formation